MSLSSTTAIAALQCASFNLGHSLEFFRQLSHGAGCVLLEGEDELEAFDSKHLLGSGMPPGDSGAGGGEDDSGGSEEELEDSRPSKRPRLAPDPVLGELPDGDGWVVVWEGEPASALSPSSKCSLKPQSPSPALRHPLPTRVPPLASSSASPGQRPPRTQVSGQEVSPTSSPVLVKPSAAAQPVSTGTPSGLALVPRRPAPGPHHALPARPLSSLVKSAMQPLTLGEHSKRRGRGGRHADRRRGKWYQMALRDPYLAKLQKLLHRSLMRSDVFQNIFFSMITNASPSGTGWSGYPMSKDKMNMLRSFYNKDEVMSIVRYFLPVYYTGKPVMLLDKEGRCFAFRTTQVPFLMEQQEEFNRATRRLMEEELNSPSTIAAFELGIRGEHFPCIIGHHRQYKLKASLTQWHQENAARVKEFMSTDVIAHATAYVSRTVEIIFPGVAQRMDEVAKALKIKPMFGVFYNLCINGIFPHQTRIHCEPHLDWKNIVGVCALLVYQDPKTPFNSRLRSWVVLWEAGVAIELPPWVVLIYPSSLLHHFNVDVKDFKFVTVDGNERPTPSNSTPISDTDGRGRGTLVYFNQSSMYQSAETGGVALKDAPVEKQTKSYPEAVKAVLEDYAYVYDTSRPYV